MESFTDSSFTPKETSWNQVYSFLNRPEQESKYMDAVAYNRRIYEGILPEQYDTLAACVEHAIASGHHGAFVHYYLERAAEQKHLFRARFLDYLTAALGTEYKKFRNFLILREDVLRSFDFNPEAENAFCDCFYYTAANLGYCLLEADDPKYMIPKRGQLLQLAFFLALNSEQLNELLLLAGYENLYPLDPVDAVCQYFLDTEEMEKPCLVGNRLYSPSFMKAKKRINEVILAEEFSGKMTTVSDSKLFRLSKKDELTQDEQLLLEQMGIVYQMKARKERIVDLQAPDEERLRSCRLYWNPKKKELSREYICRRYGYPGRLVTYRDGRFSIEEEMEQLSAQFGYHPEVSQTFYPAYLTRRFGQRVRTEGPGEYLSEMGTQKRMGFLYMTFQFLKSDSFRKNLYISRFPLTIETTICPAWIDDRLQIQYENPYELFGNLYSPISDRMEQHMDETRRQNLFYSIWELRNGMDEGTAGSVQRMPQMSVVYNLLYGRWSPEKQQEGSKAKQKGSGWYKYDIGDKRRSVQMAIVSGQEDQLGNYLMCAGYWKNNLYQEYRPVMHEQYERVDSLILYLLLYRDALLNQWVERYRMSSGSQFETGEDLRRQIHQEFPLIRLASVVSRDIQFVLHEFHAESREFLISADRWEYYLRYLKDLIYPVRNSNQRWFQFYLDKYDESGRLIHKI